MNIIANNVASKLFVAFVAASMLFMLATPAKAATVEELQAQIAALMAQISALSGGSAPAAGAGCTFTRALTVGSEGADVKCLQDYLTPTYFSNAGGSTGYFGPVTAAAVAAWQTANGVMPAAGYFGPVSQAKYNALMASAPSAGGSTGSDDEDEDMGGLSGEASLDSFEIDAAEDEDIKEGMEDAEVAQLTAEFADGDAKITRIDVVLDSEDTAADVWDVLDEVSLWVDGDEVARESASDEDDYLDTTGNKGTLRFSGLDIVAMEDEELEIVVAASIQGNVDTADQGTYSVAVSAVRYMDADDVTTTDTTTGDIDATTPTEVTFNLDEEGSDDELIVKTSSENPEATTLEVKDDAKSDWYNVFTFDLDTDDSENDIELTTVVLTVYTPATSTYNGLVDDAEIVIDGTTVSDVTVTGGTTNTATLTFDVDGDVTIDAGDRVAAELMLKFKSLAALDEGATVYAEVTSAQADLIDAEGADDLTAAQLSGSALGKTHTLRTAGVSITDFSATGEHSLNSTTADNSYGTYTFEFDVTTIGSDEIYVPLTASVNDGAASSTKGAVYKVTFAGNSIASTSADALSASLTRVSGGDTSTSGYVRLDAGDTATFQLQVVLNPGSTAGFYTVILDSVGFNASGASPANARTTASPADQYDYELNIQS